MQALWMPGEEAICIRADDGVVRSGYEEILRDWENRFVVHDLEPTKRASHVQFYTQDVEMTFNVRYIFMFLSRYSILNALPPFLIPGRLCYCTVYC